MLKHALAFLAFIAIGCAAFAQPAPDCSPAYRKVRAVPETKALFASVSEATDRQQAALETGIRDATARAQWSEQDRARFFQKVLRSPPNTDFEQQIGLLTVELRALLQASQRGEIRGAAANCRHGARLRELVALHKSVYERQSAYLTQALHKVRSGQRPRVITHKLTLSLAALGWASKHGPWLPHMPYLIGVILAAIHDSLGCCCRFSRSRGFRRTPYPAVPK